jgi:hypothetical protein
MESNMKKAVRLFPVVLLVLAAGCREYETATVIRPDGSCERSVAVTRDSDDSTRAAADLAVFAPGPGWTLVKTAKGGEGADVRSEKKFEFRASRKFHCVKELDAAMAAAVKAGQPGLSVRVKMNRKFRWFNTFYDYRETYSVRSFFADVPVTDFMTRKELDLYYQKEDTLDLKKKADAWFSEGYTRFVIGRLGRMAEGHPLPGLGPERVRAESDSLKSLLLRNMKTLEEDSTALAKLLESRFKNPRFGEWRGPLDSLQADIQRTWEALMEIGSDSYVCGVAMPGLIMDTNAPTVEGNRAEWKFEGERFQMEPYEMRVESRVMNRWAVWVTGLLVLAAVAALVAGAVRKK